VRIQHGNSTAIELQPLRISEFEFPSEFGSRISDLAAWKKLAGGTPALPGSAHSLNFIKIKYFTLYYKVKDQDRLKLFKRIYLPLVCWTICSSRLT
jgi:hypothetical protein